MTDGSDIALVRRFDEELKCFAASRGLEVEFRNEEAFLQSARIRRMTVAEIIEEMRPAMLAQIRATVAGTYDEALLRGDTVKPPVLTVIKR